MGPRRRPENVLMALFGEKKQTLRQRCGRFELRFRIMISTFAAQPDEGWRLEIRPICTHRGVSVFGTPESSWDYRAYLSQWCE